MDFVKRKIYFICKKLKYKFIVNSDGPLYKEYIIKISTTHFFKINIYEYEDQTKGVDVSIITTCCGLNSTIINKSRICYSLAKEYLGTFCDELSFGKPLTRH